MAKKAYLKSEEMAQVLRPLAEMLQLYKVVIKEQLPAQTPRQRAELDVLYNTLDTAYQSLNNLVDIADRTWQREGLRIHE